MNFWSGGTKLGQGKHPLLKTDRPSLGLTKPACAYIALGRASNPLPYEMTSLARLDAAGDPGPGGGLLGFFWIRRR